MVDIQNFIVEDSHNFIVVDNQNFIEENNQNFIEVGTRNFIEANIKVKEDKVLGIPFMELDMACKVFPY